MTTITQTSIELSERLSAGHGSQSAASLALSFHQNAQTSAPLPENASIKSHEDLATGLTLEDSRHVSKLQASMIIFQLSAINCLTSLTNGIIVVGLPHIAESIKLPQELLVWPSGVYGLASGATLLIAASIADFIGPRPVDLLGCLLVGLSCLACGLAATGIQLVIFRAFLGVAMSLHLPSSVSIIARYIPSGRRRNIGFSCLGLSQPLGFSVGLVLGGVLVQTIGWRTGFYIPGACAMILTIAGFWTLPKTANEERPQLSRIFTDIDWIGACIASTSLATLSYFLATLSTNLTNIRKPSSIALLVVSTVLMPIFPFWIHRQEQLGKPALISNSLWKKLPFTSICSMVLLSWAVMNSNELFSSLYFQEIQELSALQASLRLLPNMLLGAFLNLTTGLFVHRIPALWLLVVTSLCTAGSPLLMALINPSSSYWTGVFFAQILAPISADVLFTVGLIVVSDIFPEKTQALAGGVFNTVAQFGISLGLSLMQVISLLVSDDYSHAHKSSSTALLHGYRASFWAMFACMILTSALGAFGLRKIGRVGLKRD